MISLHHSANVNSNLLDTLHTKVGLYTDMLNGYISKVVIRSIHKEDGKAAKLLFGLCPGREAAYRGLMAERQTQMATVAKT